MPKPRSRSYSTDACNAVSLMGEMISAERIEQGITSEELAVKAGISRGLLKRVEQGDMGCGIGIVFEIASILGLSTLEESSEILTDRLNQVRRHRALLPKRVSS
jgi:transcriptional regulator with XRE-family HTH domain